ncbi:MAG: SGNH/GDSL hydrolase family protein [Rhodoglobus sp.]
MSKDDPSAAAASVRRSLGSHVAKALVGLVRPIFKVNLLAFRVEIADALFPEDSPTGEVDAPDPIKMLFIGDSAASGYGVLNHGLAVVSQTARYVAREHSRGCTWVTLTDPELTSIRAATQLSNVSFEIDFDVVVVLLGPPDVLVGTAAAEWKSSLNRLISVARSGKNPHCPVVFAAVPPLHNFRAMPSFVRRILAMQTHRLNRATLVVVASRPAVSYSRFPTIGTTRDLSAEFVGWRTVHSLWGRQLGSDTALAVPPRP